MFVLRALHHDVRGLDTRGVELGLRLRDVGPSERPLPQIDSASTPDALL